MNEIKLVEGLGVGAALIGGIVLHHYAHARVAWAFGDKTRKFAGRMTLSPKAHVDPLGTIVLPVIWILAVIFAYPGFAVMFGWGKRQPVNESSLRDGRRGAVLVALAGPAATFAVALFAGLVVRSTAQAASLSPLTSPGIVTIAAAFVALVATTMTVIELLPVPGRDGARVLMRFLSPQAAYKMEDLAQYDVLFLLVIFLFFQAIASGMVQPLCAALTGSPPNLPIC